MRFQLVYCCNEQRQCTSSQHLIAVRNTVTGDVTQQPHALLDNPVVG
jgi:hypothetical protein